MVDDDITPVAVPISSQFPECSDVYMTVFPLCSLFPLPPFRAMAIHSLKEAFSLVFVVSDLRADLRKDSLRSGLKY